MNYFNWKKIYETGISGIDIQHQELFVLVNSFYTELFSDTFSPQNNLIYIKLEELNNYYDFHFNYERTVYSDEFILKYFDAENMLAKKIDALLQDEKEVDIIALYRFAEFLRKWLIKHVLILNDRTFQKVLRKDVCKISCN